MIISDGAYIKLDGSSHNLLSDLTSAIEAVYIKIKSRYGENTAIEMIEDCMEKATGVEYE